MPAGEPEAPGQEVSDEEVSDEEVSDEPVYVISIAAKLAGLPSWTLRVLDKEGIVRPKRTAKDRRLYSDRDITLLARIRYLTEERGVNMNGVKLILEMEGFAPETTEPETAQ
ncbi:MAG: MerR family transcriptional regulator [Janthinobacterium lividum]